MRIPRLLLFLALLLTFSNSSLFSQINGHLIADVYAQDSLQGFNQNQAQQSLVSEGFLGQALSTMMKQARRQFVINKYNLYARYNLPQTHVVGPSYSNGRYSSGITNNAPCVNEDFEAGTLAGWTASVGFNVTSQTYPTTPTSVTLGSDVAIMTTTFTDAYVGTIPASPLGGTKVIKIGNNGTGGVATKLVQTFSVTPTNYLFDFAYWAVMEDAGATGTPHSCTATPYMLIKVFDDNGTPQTCPVFSIVAPATGGCSGIGPLTWSTVAVGTQTIKTSNGWQKFSIDLSGQLNTLPVPYKNVTIEVVVADCALGGHFGYAYFDAHCGTMDVNVNSVLHSLISPTVYPQVICGGTATMTAPSGIVSYTWSGPTGSTTAQTMTTTTPGTYTLKLFSPGFCNTISRIISLQFVPPTTVTASNPTICGTGTSTLTASGAASYTWAVNGSTQSAIVVTPTITTIYTVTARTGTCTGTFTVQVLVSPNPNLSVVASNFTICPGQSATLTAFGANSYVWQPGSMTGSVVIVSPPPGSTTYTTVGTSTAGCTGSITTTITNAAITMTIVALTPTYVCSGTAVSYAAGGASTFTWLPDNVTGFLQTFNPTITTTYTVLGASGSCTVSATTIASVNPGPSMTLTANPAIVCPGNTTTLSVVSPSAVGAFTWMPGSTNASSIVVTPTIAGGYSVSAADAMGCKNTQTINPNISPVPSLTISPASPSVCFGGTVTVTATGAINYTWLPVNLNGSSVALSPTLTTTYTVIGANAAGCTSTTTVVVSVLPQPTLVASALPSSICRGNCFTLSTTGVATSTLTPANLCPTVTTNYVVSGTGAGGCPSNTVPLTVTVNVGPTMTVSASPAAICAGGTSTLSATGATSYSWSTSSTSSSITVNPVITTVYTVTGFNAFGCSTTRTVMVTVNPTPTIGITPASPTICPGGSATLTANGGLTYTWLPGGSNFTSIVVNPSSNATFTVNGTSAGCTGQATVLVTVAPAPIITASFNPATICAGSCATLVASGALTYTVNGLSAVACPTITSNYTVTGSNAAGCISNTIVGTLNVISAPNVLAFATPTAICPGDSSNLSALGASSFTWQPGGNVGSSFWAHPLTTTVYTVSGTNAAGCIGTGTITVVVSPTPTITASASPTSICSGANATLTANGGSSYFWNPGSLSGSPIFVSPTITTTYTVTDNSSACSGSATVVVFVTPTPTVTLTPSSLTLCAGSILTMTASGATNYTWSTGSTATIVTATPVSNTTYTMRGFTNGCGSNVASITVTVNAVPSFTLSKTPTSICPGANATLSATGATNYTWQPVNQFGSSIIVSPGSSTTYTVTGSNGTSCISTRTINLTVNPGVAITAAASPTSVCSGGAVNLSAGGSSGYTWSPGGLTGANVTVNPTITTIYTVVSTNTFGCSGQATVLVNVLPVPSVSITASPTAVCPGGCSTLTATGATNYTWSVGAFGSSITVCPSLTVTYTVIGSSGGCVGVATKTITVSSPPLIVGSATPVAVCPGGSTTLTATGGTSYTWQPVNQNGSSIVVNPTISTTYTVYGANSGCTGWDTVGVTVNPVPPIFAIATPTAICNGQSSVLNAAGGSTYLWLPGNLSGSSVTVSPNVTTLYTVIGTLAGCSGTANVVVVVNPGPNVTASVNPVAVCSGVTATLTASGATSYNWLPSGSGSPYVIIPVVSQVYTVVGTNGFGCSGTATVNVVVSSPPSLSITASGSNTICAGSSLTLTGSGAINYTWSTSSPFASIIVTPTITTVYTLYGSNGTCTSSINYTVFVGGGVPLAINATTTQVCAGYTVGLLATGATNYTWQPMNSTSNPIVVTPAATSVYTVTAFNGLCTSSATIGITVNPLPIITMTANPTQVCAGYATTLTAFGGVTYSWIPTLVGGSVYIDSPTSSTTYTVVGFDAIGCPNYDTTMVTVLPALNISIVANPTAVCLGGSATLTANGAISYIWNTSSGNNPLIVTPVTSTSYSVLGTDASGCMGMASIFLPVNPLPNVSIFASAGTLCAGSTLTLTGNGALTYNWSPINQNGTIVTDNPITNTTYTVTGTDANGCSNQAIFSVNVTPGPTLTAVATPTAVCQGNPITLSATGANTYTWNPGGQQGSSIVETPNTTTTYTVSGTDGSGCTSMLTVLATVIQTPTLTITPPTSAVCIGSSATLTASGAANYTWAPSGNHLAVEIVTPLVTTVYTVMADNAGLCFSSLTATVNVNPLPANVNATSSGTVSCSDPNANLFGTCTDLNVSYSWAGPQGFSSSLQNATVSGIWGNFTLTVTDNVTGCMATAIVNVPTDNSIPLVTATASGSITCKETSVTLNAAHTTTNPAYSWIGPAGFTSTIQTPVVSVAGSYTITVTDLSSTCSSTAMVTVGVHTLVTITGSITPAGCSGGVSNNDGKINLLGAGGADKYDIVLGTTYNGTATYANAALIPASGVITSNLANPTNTVAYTVRIFDAFGCIKDTTLFLIPVDCSLRTLGVAKAASSPVLNADGSYNVTYTVVVKNYDAGNLRDIALTENLSNTFPSPATFTVYPDSIQKVSGSSLILNTAFDGISQTNLLSAVSNTLQGDSTEKMKFTVRVNPNMFFIAYYNSVLGTALNSVNKTVIDSSNAGLEPDAPDFDDNPYNNNKQTPVIFNSHTFFGITKTGEIHASDNNSFDVSYTVTIHNLGNDTIRNVTLNDSLLGTTIKNPASYSIRSAPVSSGGGLMANSAFNGGSDIRLILPESQMPPRTVSSIQFVINVVPGSITMLSNSAYGNALTAKDATSNVTVSDTSNAGTNPDSNGNGIWNEAADNVPTILLIPNTHTLFIPEGFSPNGDNINQNWVIEGLPTAGENSVIIYNRWGNKVYSNPNYDNSWDGTPNVSGTLGKNKLPEGTYFFILDMKGSGIKPITGFVVLQY